jgi:nucleoside 2-deoxyribosyltransferase
MKLYLAGPDVFLPNALEIGSRKRALCAARGFEGLFPIDVEADPKRPASAASIFSANCALMRLADAGVFNLTPFRGPSADAGTVFELGFLFALGKPVHGYASRGGDYAQRVREQGDKLARRGGRLWDEAGFAVEDFGLPDNLMIARAIAEAGSHNVVVEEMGPEALAAFGAFEALVDRLAGRGPPPPRATSGGSGDGSGRVRDRRLRATSKPLGASSASGFAEAPRARRPRA